MAGVGGRVSANLPDVGDHAKGDGQSGVYLRRSLSASLFVSRVEQLLKMDHSEKESCSEHKVRHHQQSYTVSLQTTEDVPQKLSRAGPTIRYGTLKFHDLSSCGPEYSLVATF